MEGECVRLPVYLVEEEMVHECLKCGGNIQGCMSAKASVLRSVCEGGRKMNNAVFTFVEYNELKCCLLLNSITRRRASDHPPFLPAPPGTVCACLSVSEISCVRRR